MKPTGILKLAAAFVGALALATTPLFAQDAAADDKAATAELAKKLANPVASLISVPIQNNWDFGIGPANAMRYTANIQPVIPFTLNTNWNLITRTIMPVIYAESPVSGGGSKSGLGDIVQSFFFSPKAPVGGWILSAGPVMLYPTATDEALGFGKWGAGPTVLALQQNNGWTYGLLANHLWSYADAGRYNSSSADDASDGSDAQVNATFIQPFVSYTTKTFTTFGLNTESTYDWSHSQWTVPLNVSVSQLLKIGKQPVQFSLGVKYYAEKPANGPDWGLRFAVTFLFPK
ncbi:MAG: transporter [Verrucomicrobiota bacterium]|jgi:hypothetical protein